MGYLILIGGLVLSLLFYTSVRDLPSVDSVLKKGVSPSKYSQVFGSDGSVILSYGKFRHQKVKLAQVSPHFIQALLATEDRRFYEHHGVDVMALLRAVGRDIMHRRLLEGGSTLTQQLARNVFLSNERSFRRKIREAILAVELENHLTKKQILELYVNNIYFGEGAYGIAAASEIYFGKQPSQLTVDEAALLAGMPQAPSNYSPFRNPKVAMKRRNEVLDNLKEWGKLTSAQASLYKNRPFHLNPGGLNLGSADKAPYFNRYVLRQIQSQFDLDEQSFWQSGLKIYTTLNPRAQAVATQVVRELSDNYGRTKVKQQAALLCIDPKTGGIVAYIGGKNYTDSQFDRVSQATRSPGSLFKVFTYTAAIEKGISPFRQYVDEPIYFGGWKPENFDRSHHGAMPVYRAFYTSNNVIAVKLLRDLGPGTVIDLARRMGLNANLDDNLTLTLGGSGLTLLDITAAFSVLANQGIRNEPYAIERIVDADGQELYKHRTMPNQVLQRPTADTMVSMMQYVVSRGTGRGADFGHPAAGKTGTSDDHRDSWFVGFTPNYITGVWVGNDDNSSMPGMVGGSLPATIWRNFMQSFTANALQTQFDLTYSQFNQRSQPVMTHPPAEDATPQEETYEATTEGGEYIPPELRESAGKPKSPDSGNLVPSPPAQDANHTAAESGTVNKGRDNGPANTAPPPPAAVPALPPLPEQEEQPRRRFFRRPAPQPLPPPPTGNQPDESAAPVPQ